MDRAADPLPDAANARIALKRGSRGPAGPPHKGEGEDKKACPFCRSTDVQVISLFGSQVMTMQCKCRHCGSFFESSKY